MQKQTNESTSNNNTRWEFCHHLIATCPLPIVALEGETFRIRVANLAFCALAGKPPEQLLDLPLLSLLPTEEATRCAGLIQRVWETGETSTLPISTLLPTTIPPLYLSYLS